MSNCELPILKLREAFDNLPSAQNRSAHLRKEIKAVLKPASHVPILVILDDDPTGTQTCHGIDVLTIWDASLLEEQFRSVDASDGPRGFFILTNTRALHPPEARTLVEQICRNVKLAAERVKVQFEIVLRGDSTLRGHFPLEAEAVDSALGESDAWILCPAFIPGGRFTINDIHYVAEGQNLVPAAQTPFAKDATFGYDNSDLRLWLNEKCNGNIEENRISSISITDIRTKGENFISKRLAVVPRGAIVIVNAVSEEDIDVVVSGIIQATRAGKRFLYRTAASFVSARLGISALPIVQRSSLNMSTRVGGLVIAGSYVPKTTSQLAALVKGRKEKLTVVLLDVVSLLGDRLQADATISSAVRRAEAEISTGQDVLVMTSRKLISGSDKRSSLDIGSVVASGLVSIVKAISTRPRYIIAKGGITSSDCATKSLNMRRALVVGQAEQAVPLWRCDDKTCKFPGLPYVVFPGNVGNENSLLKLVERFSSENLLRGT